MRKVDRINIILIVVIFLSLLSLKFDLQDTKRGLRELDYALEELTRENANLREQVREFVDKWDVGIFETTAYTHTGNRTKTGTWPKVGTIAVDPTVIPLGTKMFIQGYGWGVAEDTGGLIKGNIIDLFMETEDECWEHGRRKVPVIWKR